jgi:sodium-dependent dicarboxylate transporter 2/3/5
MRAKKYLPAPWKLGIIAAATILFFSLSAYQPEGISAEGWLSIRTLVLMGVLWMTEAIPLAATALLPLLVFSVGMEKSAQPIFASYAHPLIFLFLGGFILGAAIQHSNAHRWLAYRISKVFS